MKTKKHKKIQMSERYKNLALRWLKKQGWKNESNYMIEFLLGLDKLEDLPYRPHFLISKDEHFFFVNLFNKDDYFWSKHFGYYMTGMDFYKYRFLQALQNETKVQPAVLIWNETLKEFIFRVLEELSKPVIWHRNKCLAQDYQRKEEILECFKCWRNNPLTVRKCIHRKTKTRPMAMWDVSCFGNKTNYQIKMFNEPTKIGKIPKNI